MIRKTWLPLLLTMAAVPVLADDDDWRRDRSRDRDRTGWGWERGRDRDRDRNRDRNVWGRNDRYGSGQYGGGNVYVVDQAMNNLRRVASRNRVDSHERNHFERALYHLDRFRDNYSRERRFDKSRLDDAIEHIDDLADARQINPRDREVLARDLRALRDFRSRGGSYSW